MWTRICHQEASLLRQKHDSLILIKHNDWWKDSYLLQWEFKRSTKWRSQDTMWSTTTFLTSENKLRECKPSPLLGLLFKRRMLQNVVCLWNIPSAKLEKFLNWAIYWWSIYASSLFWKMLRGNSSCSLIDVETYILSLGSIERNDTDSVDSQEKKNYYPRSRPIIDLRQNSRNTRMKENHGNGPSSKCTCCTFCYMSILAAVIIMIVIILSGLPRFLYYQIFEDFDT